MPTTITKHHRFAKLNLNSDYYYFAKLQLIHHLQACETCLAIGF